MKIEHGIGAGLGLLVFLGTQGYNVVPVLFLIGLALLLLQAPMAGRLGGRKITVRPQSRFLVSFGEIGGHVAAKQELVEALDFVNLRDEASALGIRPLRGVLLSGPPGTGKTMLAKAAASHTDSVFLATSGSEFIEVYAGVGAQRVRQLFADARATAKREKRRTAVIFIDEIEVLAPERGTHRGHLEYDQTLNQLLVEMDGLKTEDDIQLLIIAATNRYDLLDPALLRPGRFDRIVQVGMPDREDRLQILSLHVQNKPLADDVELDEVARATFGFSGAHLESVANEAAILALREGCGSITSRHFSEATDKVIMGERLGRRPSDEELRRIASHEGGHALVAEAICPGTVASVTVASRGMALGYVRQIPRTDQLLQTQEQLEENIDIALSGPLAEKMLCGSRSTGAAQDFKVAAEGARNMVLAGMTGLGVVLADTVPAGLMHRAIRDVLAGRERRVRETLESGRGALVRLRDLLLERETLSGDELRRLLMDFPCGGAVLEGRPDRDDAAAGPAVDV
ncbi:MAG: AAA family ATPase [Bacillota bacterium]|nr:AAA family ATPase [Bacillota bacterium]